jgi:hypothetical protein
LQVITQPGQPGAAIPAHPLHSSTGDQLYVACGPMRRAPMWPVQPLAATPWAAGSLPHAGMQFYAPSTESESESEPYSDMEA